MQRFDDRSEFAVAMNISFLAPKDKFRGHIGDLDRSLHDLLKDRYRKDCNRVLLDAGEHNTMSSFRLLVSSR